MRRAIIFILPVLAAIALVLAFGQPAFAKSKKKAKEKVFDFEGDVIQTEYLRPDQMTIEAISKRKNKGFIKIRTDFFKEIVRSAEDL